MVHLTEKLLDEADRKWLMENRMVTWPMTSPVHERSRSWLQYA